MPGTILGLKISHDSVTAVQVTSRLKGYQITACCRLKIEENGSLAESLQMLSQQMDLKSDAYIASIPGKDMSFRNLHMPFTDSKKIRQTLSYEIERIIPFPIEDIIVDFTRTDQTDRSEILAASAPKAHISDYIEKLKVHGIDPDILEIGSIPIVSCLFHREGIEDNGLFLDIGTEKSTMVLYLKRRIALIRIFTINGNTRSNTPNNSVADDTDIPNAERIESGIEAFCKVIQDTIHSFSWQAGRQARPEKVFFTGTGSLYPRTKELLGHLLDIPAEQINLSRDKRVHMESNIAGVWDPALMDGALALTLRDTKKETGFNFRKDEFEVKKLYLGFKKEIRRAAVLLLLILLFLATDLGMDYYFLKNRYNMANQRGLDLFMQVFPDVKKIQGSAYDNMISKMKEQKKSAFLIPEIKADQKVLDLIKDISDRIQKTLDLRVTSMVVDFETVRISGETDTFNTVDSIKTGLESSDYFKSITISSAKLDRSGKRVQFEMRLHRAE